MMADKFFAKKIKMTQIWNDAKVVPVTELLLEEASRGALEALKAGDKVRVSAKSKGRGFQGVVKRHGFHGGPKTHGQKNRLRAPGSLGPTAPQRVVPGRKMAGHMGATRVTVRNLMVAAVLPDANSLQVRGAVPGMRGGRVEIRRMSS